MSHDCEIFILSDLKLYKKSCANKLKENELDRSLTYGNRDHPLKKTSLIE